LLRRIGRYMLTLNTFTHTTHHALDHGELTPMISAEYVHVSWCSSGEFGHGNMQCLESVQSHDIDIVSSVNQHVHLDIGDGWSHHQGEDPCVRIVGWELVAPKEMEVVIHMV
jgi:hypothetical protein